MRGRVRLNASLPPSPITSLEGASITDQVNVCV